MIHNAGPASDTYQDPEVGYLLELLLEYTEKVRASLRELDKLRFSAVATATLFVAVLLSAGLYFDGVTVDSELLIMLPIAAGTVAILPVQFAIILRKNQRELRRLSRALGSLIPRASQMEDHGNVNPAQQLVLVLRLSDAESALRDAVRALGPTSPKSE